MKEDEFNGFESFAEGLAILGKLTKIDSAVRAAMERSRVPPGEVRKLLKCSRTSEVSNTPLYQFMKELFKSVGLGEIEIEKMDNFRCVFSIENNPVAKAYRLKGKRTCYITADALKEFFVKDLGLPSEVSETTCINEGAKKCLFSVEIQPLAVYKIAMDAVDREIVRELVKDEPIQKIAEKIGLHPEEMEYRLTVLRNYQIIDKDNKITEVGKTYHMYVKDHPQIEEDFPPPWEDMQRITSAIAAAESFARAFEQTAFKEPLFEVDEEKVVNLSEEAKKSRSFAELLCKQIKKEESDEQE